MAVRRIMRRLSSKYAIDTPTSCLVLELDVPQPGVPARISRADSTPAHHAISRDDTRPPSSSFTRSSRVRFAMAIPIGDNRGHDDSTLDDVLDVGVEANEREPARHDAEDDGADDGAGDPPDAARKAR